MNIFWIFLAFLEIGITLFYVGKLVKILWRDWQAAKADYYALRLEIERICIPIEFGRYDKK